MFKINSSDIKNLVNDIKPILRKNISTLDSTNKNNLDSNMYKWMLTFTKKWMSRIILFAFIWISFCIIAVILSFKLHLTDMAINCLIDFAKTILTVVMSVFIVYMGKALFETKWEKANDIYIAEKGLDIKSNDIERVNDDNKEVNNNE